MAGSPAARCLRAPVRGTHALPPHRPLRLPDPDTFDHDAALAACARGDRAALRRLYEREAGFLLGVALRIVRDRAAAEDVLHDAFMNFWTKAATFDARRGAGRGWMVGIVRHRALDAVRAGARTVSADEETMDALRDDEDAAPDMAEAFATRADLGRLDDCLARLDTAKRNCVLYAYLDGCTHTEIAERLGAPLGSVKAWIRRGLNSLRECLA